VVVASPAPLRRRRAWFHSGVRTRYLAVGHVVADVLAGGERRAGGTALYSALQAARLGLTATVVTRGDPAELGELLAPYEAELELIVQPAAETTTLLTDGSGSERRQRVQAWAGPVALERLPGAEILHLAPVAAELAGRARGGWPFVGLTPQGLVRRWEGPEDVVRVARCDPALIELAGRCDALVISEHEADSCAGLVERGLRDGATVAVTHGPASTRILLGRDCHEVAVEPVADPADDLGAGDVYAAAMFVALARGAEALTAARFAGAAAALRMLGTGPGAIADREAIERRAWIEL
jgi:sugar/nucleoside kinase (ribokinase family)